MKSHPNDCGCYRCREAKEKKIQEREEMGCAALVITVALIVLSVIGYFIHKDYERDKNTKFIGTEYREYKIIGVNPPKHVSISIYNEKTGEFVDHLSIAKHMNDWREYLIIGRIVTIPVHVYEYEGKKIYRWGDVEEAVRTKPIVYNYTTPPAPTPAPKNTVVH